MTRQQLVLVLTGALSLFATFAACSDGRGADNTTGGGDETLEDCARAGDEDGNGQADCADAACANTSDCNADAEDCANGADDDGDGDADCADADCAASAACACVDAPAASTVTCDTHSACRDDACPGGEALCDFAGVSGVAAGHCTLAPVVYANNKVTTGEAADFSCYATPQTLTPGTDVTVYGCVDSFGLAVASTRDVEIYMWRAENFFTTLAATGAPPVTAEFGPFASIRTTSVFDLATDCPYDGAFLAPGVPRGEKLVVRVSNENNVNFVNTWVFNFAVADEEVTGDIPAPVAASGVTEAALLNVAVISGTTYATIPPLAGLPGGVPEGEGVIAGEIGDCSNRVTGNAKVSLTPSSRKFTYFNAGVDEDGLADSKPDPRRKTSHVDGLYAGLGVPAGLLTLNASVPTADGGVLDLGSFRAAIFSGDVTILSIRGRQRTPDAD